MGFHAENTSRGESAAVRLFIQQQVKKLINSERNQRIIKLTNLKLCDTNSIQTKTLFKNRGRFRLLLFSPFLLHTFSPFSTINLLFGISVKNILPKERKQAAVHKFNRNWTYKIGGSIYSTVGGIVTWVLDQFGWPPSLYCRELFVDTACKYVESHHLKQSHTSLNTRLLGPSLDDNISLEYGVCLPLDYAVFMVAWHRKKYPSRRRRKTINTNRTTIIYNWISIYGPRTPYYIPSSFMLWKIDKPCQNLLNAGTDQKRNNFSNPRWKAIDVVT